MNNDGQYFKRYIFSKSSAIIDNILDYLDEVFNVEHREGVAT